MEPVAAAGAGGDVSADGLIAELLDMGFDFDDIAGAGQPRRGGGAPSRPASSAALPRPAGKGTQLRNPRGRLRQSSITDQ